MVDTCRAPELFSCDSWLREEGTHYAPSLSPPLKPSAPRCSAFFHVRGLSKAYTKLKGATRKSRKQYTVKGRRKKKEKDKRKGKERQTKTEKEREKKKEKEKAWGVRPSYGPSSSPVARMLSVGPARSVNIHTDQGTWRQHCMSRNVLTNGHGDVSVRKKEKEGSDGSSLGSNRLPKPLHYSAAS